MDDIMHLKAIYRINEAENVYIKEPSKDKAKRFCHKWLGLLKKLNCSLFCDTSVACKLFQV
jgi:hypothetical protein